MRSAAGGSSPTPRRCRCSRSTAARASSSRSSTARFCGSPATSRAAPEPVFFHDPDAGDARTIDVGLDRTRLRTPPRQHLIEQRGEDLRLAYVALTRAKHQAVIWWAGSWDSRHSPLGRLLFAADADGNVAPDGDVHAERRRGDRALRGSSPPSARRMHQRRALDARAADSRGARRHSQPLDLVAARVRPPPRPALAAHVLQRHHRRSARTAGRERARGAEPRRRAASAAAGRPPAGATPAGSSRSTAVAARRRCRSGSEFGTFVHRVLEATDFAAADLDAELRRAGRRRAGARASSTSVTSAAGDRRAAGGDRDAARAARRRHPPARPRRGRPARRARVRAAARRRR